MRTFAPAVLATLLVAPAVGATNAPPAIVVPASLPYGAVPSCWPEVRLYETLRFGPVDFCRKRLSYRPGRLECYVITDQVCWVLLVNGGWVQTRTPIAKQVFPCPPGAEPPVCRQLDLQ